MFTIKRTAPTNARIVHFYTNLLIRPSSDAVLFRDVPNLIEYVRLWSNNGAKSDSDRAPCVEPKLSSTKVRQTIELNAFAAPN